MNISSNEKAENGQETKESKCSDSAAFPSFTDDEYKNDSLEHLVDKLNQQFHAILSVSDPNEKEKQDEFVQQFDASLEQLSIKSGFPKLFKHFVVISKCRVYAINHSNINIKKVLIKYNDKLYRKDKIDNLFDETEVLKLALQQEKELFNPDLIRILMENGATLDDFENEHDYMYKPSALYYCVDNDNYKFETLKMLINLDNKYKFSNEFNYKKHFGERIITIKVIIANAIRNNSFQSLKYLLSLDKKFNDNLVLKACCYDGTLINWKYRKSPIVDEETFIFSLIENDYRDMWNFLKENVYSKNKNTIDISNLVKEFNVKDALYVGAINKSKTQESELFWVKELIKFGVVVNWDSIEKYGAKSLETLELLFENVPSLLVLFYWFPVHCLFCLFCIFLDWNGFV